MASFFWFPTNPQSRGSIQSGDSIASRRTFLKQGAVLAAATSLGGSWRAAGASAPMKAAIIGDTGHGNYGHGLELIFKDRPGIQVVAVADPDANGRAQAAQRSGALRQYADYREMLAEEKPDLVSVAPRWTDHHHAMTKAALEAGAHVYSEKPFTQTLAQADDLLAVAAQSKRKIAVAHQTRLGPSIPFLKQELEGGLIGDLLQINAHGKQDRRAGGEDMIVLGTHLFDLMRFLAGEAQWCTARIQEKGREVGRADAHPATEGIGPIVGDEIEAQFGMARGVLGTFTSRGRNQATAGTWGLELVGSKGVVRVIMSMVPILLIREPGGEAEAGWSDQWKPLADDPRRSLPKDQLDTDTANRRVVDDWLEAIQEDRDPVCSGFAAMKAIEMVMAVFEAGVSGQRVALPLARRDHPLKG